MEKTVRKNTVFQGKILSLRVDDALSEKGTPCKREIVEHSGGVCVLPVQNGRMLLVRQYRYAYGEYTYEIPAGKREAEEEPLLCGKRELQEETGFTAEEWVSFGSIYPSPGYTNEIIYIYLAKGLTAGETHFDEDECIDTLWVSKAQAIEMIQSGEITDAKTVIAILRYIAGV